jgi:hypothetical protein
MDRVTHRSRDRYTPSDRGRGEVQTQDDEHSSKQMSSVDPGALRQVALRIPEHTLSLFERPHETSHTGGNDESIWEDNAVYCGTV